MEPLRSAKLNIQSGNQIFIYMHKPEGRMRYRDAGSREVVSPGDLDQDLKMYAEYREISTTPHDVGNFVFLKTFNLPPGMFADILPVAFIKLGYGAGSIPHIHPVVKNPTKDRLILQAYDLSTVNAFDTDMDYFANIVVFSAGATDLNTLSFYPVDWGGDTEKLPISSQALNQMAKNTDYLQHKRVDGIIRNVDFQTKDPDPFVKYINNETVIYARYEEFQPGTDLFDRSDSSDQDVPKQFIQQFDFPRNYFLPTIQPVVIFSIGAKKVSEPGTEIRKISATLKSIRSSSFKLLIREWSKDQSFSTLDTYFVNYIAIGQAVIDNDERI